ncbi:M61 family metallopeptidase [Desertivirga brevis]|uniref:M61 family metallopeptidase n=1 Tax=Desertivirga brevis TaxID=2810310 RepID=UPI001A975D56|nr:hypothetical protein [Pedobacter sp. SYSU D00873]
MKLKFLLLLAFLSVKTKAQYQYDVDLINIEKDQVKVELRTPKVTHETVTYSFPKAIPGSYARKDYGRFISDFTAFSKEGKKLKVEKLNTNQYRISNAQSLEKIRYQVKDTWDEMHKDFIFQPGGTNIEEGKNFVINNHAFYGYFEEYKTLPIELTVAKPSDLFAATHLPVENKSNTVDRLYAKNYVELADNPVIYAKPDTSSFMVGKTRINVFVYSATGKVKSQQVADLLKPMVTAMDKFFSGLPVSSYQFLYFFEDPKKGLVDRSKGEGGFGALEHNYSSLYYLPETSFKNELKSMLLDVSTHEFLHILTPLNLHSTEIENFDFTSPKMSQHLWLYEGVTEYFSQLAQLQSNLIDEKKFIKAMQEKIYQSVEFGDFSMTEMSRRVMEDEFQKKYTSVYNRGALLALMLDLEIRQKTAGVKSLKSVVQSLAGKYGPQKPFQDESLLDLFIAESHPDIANFFNAYIKGVSKMPIKEYFGKIGFDCHPYKRIEGYYAGRFGKRFDESLNVTVFTNVEKNLLGLQNGDILLRIQDIEVTNDNVEELWERYFDFNLNAPEVYVTVRRKGVEQVLSAKLYRVHVDLNNYLEEAKELTPEQKQLFHSLVTQR